MKKDTTIHIRVRSTELEKVKDAGLNYSDIWRLGMERFYENELDELKKLSKKLHKKWTHVDTLIRNYGKKSEQEYEKLDELYKWYTKQSRDIDNPTDRDKQTLRLQMTKRDIHMPLEQVFEYFRNKRGEQ